MSLELNSHCLLCHLQRNLKLAWQLGDAQTADAFARELVQQYLDAPAGASSPTLGPGVTRLLQKYYGLEEDRYKKEKEVSNRFVMERYDGICHRIAQSADPLFAALQYAILGNYIDFSALQGEVSFEKLDAMLETAKDIQVDMEVYRTMLRELEMGRKLLYLTDNAGEICLDRIFAEQLQKRYPHLEITFCVRGGPAHNDATRADAHVAGIPFPVIDNGNCVGGTELSLLSQEAREAMDAADVIFAKGQGNCETLLGCGYPIYYAFLVKCQRYAQHFGKPLMTPMLVAERG